MKPTQFLFSLLLLGLFAACANDTDSPQKVAEAEISNAVTQPAQVVEVANKTAVDTPAEVEDQTPVEPKEPELSEAEKAAAAKEKAREEAYRKASEERSRKRKEVRRKKREAEAAAAKASEKSPVATVKSEVASAENKIADKDLYISAEASAKGVMTFANSVHNFGEIDEGDVIDYSFKFTNTGKGPLEITNVKASCGCTQPSFPFMPIAPGETGKIDVRFNSKGKFGNQKPLITVFTNAQTEPYKLYLEGKVKYE